MAVRRCAVCRVRIDGRRVDVRTLFAEPLTDRMLAETRDPDRVDRRLGGGAACSWSRWWPRRRTWFGTAATTCPTSVACGWSQRGARAVAAGLLALLPMLTQGSPAIAGASGAAPAARAAGPGAPARSPRTSVGARAAAASGTRSRGQSRRSPTTYVVRAGDSVFGIARHLRRTRRARGRHVCGADPRSEPRARDGRWRTFHQSGPDRRRMGPAVACCERRTSSSSRDVASDTRHTVLPGESLWSIADDELGDATLWPELFEANAGRTFQDGRALRRSRLAAAGMGPDRAGRRRRCAGRRRATSLPDAQQPPAPISTRVM